MKSAPSRYWLWLNFKIGGLSIGAAARLQLFEEALVRQKGLLSADEFQEILTLAQLLPGPNLVNLSACAGYRLCSLPALIGGLLLLIAPGSLLAILVFLWVPLGQPAVAQLFRGFAIGAFLLMGRFLWNLARGMRPAARSDEAHAKRKSVGRYILAALLSAGVFSGAPLLPLIGVGFVLALIWEFAA